MIYHTVRLQLSDYGLEFNFYESEVDREEKKTTPVHDFYHYPETMSQTKAVYELYQYRAKNLEEQLDMLRRELEDTNDAYRRWLDVQGE